MTAYMIDIIVEKLITDEKYAINCCILELKSILVGICSVCMCVCVSAVHVPGVQKPRVPALTGRLSSRH